MSTVLYRLGRTAFRHRGRFLVGWSLLIVAFVGGFAAWGSRFDSEFIIPGSQSQEGIDILQRALPTATGVQAQLVFVAPAGMKITDRECRSDVERTMRDVSTAPQVATVVDPFEAKSVSADQRVALAQVLYSVKRDALLDSSVTALEGIAEHARRQGLQVEVGGTIYSSAGVEVGATEGFGVVVALLVLVFTLGSMLAAGMTLFTALVGLAIGLIGLLLVSNLATVSSTAPTLALMIGLAVGIDYALLIVSRHRTQLAAGLHAEESVARATATAGSAVTFAGLTVVIALVGLTVVGIPVLSAMGLAAAGTVLTAVAVAVTLLPALLGFAGYRLEPGPGSRAGRRELEVAAGRGGIGEWWARLVIRRPLLTVLGIVIGLVVVALPATQLALALPDNGTAPPASTQRKAYDLISHSFGPGYNGRLLVLVQTDDGQPVQAATRVAAGLDLPDVLAVSDPQAGVDGRTAIITVVPKAGPRAESTRQLVLAIRAVAPNLAAAAGASVLVTGSTAAAIDVSDKLDAALLPFVTVVVGLSLILLLVVFRSVVVPLKAAVGFLLSAAASAGVVVAAFQWGWLSGLTGIATTGPVFSFTPIVLIAVLFGLAMDYEVFLVSRMREDVVHHGDPTQAIVAGSRCGARVVTAAALIMLTVFGSFATTDDLVLKPIAFGLAVGIAVDAFLVRMTLVPAVLALAGPYAWALPGWLDKALPNLDIEGAKLDLDAQARDSLEVLSSHP